MKITEITAKQSSCLLLKETCESVSTALLCVHLLEISVLCNRTSHLHQLPSTPVPPNHRPLLYFPCLLTSLSWLIMRVLYVHTEKAMAPHSSTLAWKIPWTEEPGRLQSLGSLRVGHDWATSLSLFTFMHGRRKWQPTPVFLPGESQGRGSLVGCHLWGCTDSDTTEVT